jgi:ribonuclease HI
MSLIIEEELTSLIVQVDNILSKPFLAYDVEFGDFKYKFQQPITREETLEFKAAKKKFLKAIFTEALAVLVENIVDSDGEDIVDSNPWQTVDMFLRTDVKAEEIQSEYGAEVIKAIKEKAKEAAKDGTNKIPLDLDSVYVAQQLDEDWNEEKQEKLLRKNDVD